jgi:hypothetical protein
VAQLLGLSRRCSTAQSTVAELACAEIRGARRYEGSRTERKNLRRGASQRIRASEDGVRRTWRWCCMAGAWGLAGGGVVAWPHVASAVTRQPARSVKQPVPLTCEPSCLFKLIYFLSKLQLHNSQT